MHRHILSGYRLLSAFKTWEINGNLNNSARYAADATNSYSNINSNRNINPTIPHSKIFISFAKTMRRSKPEINLKACRV